MDDGGQTVDHNPSLLEQTVSMISFAALAAQTWELLVSFTDEVEYLWGGKFNFVKGLYFCSRYAMLVAQIVNQLLSFRFQERASHPSHICPGIFVYKTIISQMSLSLVEMILLIRVYVLCNQSYKAKRLLLLVFSLTTVLETTGTAIVCHSLAQESGCMPPEPNKKGMTIFGIGAGFCQAVIFATTVTKFLARGRAGWTRTPLVSLMLRDGLVTFFLIMALLSVMIVYAITIHNIDIEVGNAGFAWFIALLSIAASRLILNTRKIAVTRRGSHSSEDEGVTNSLHDNTCKFPSSFSGNLNLPEQH